MSKLGLSVSQIKEMEKRELDEIERAVRLIFRNQFTQSPKAKGEKTEDNLKHDLGFSYLGVVNIDPKTKAKTITENIAVRTYQTFMNYAFYNDVMFFTPNTFGRAWKRCEENVDYLNALVVDVDDCDCLVALWERINESEIPVLPTIINKTDKGFHVFYVLDTPLKAKKLNRARYKKTLKGLIHKLGGDSAASSVVNYYRIPKNIEYINESNICKFDQLEKWISAQYTSEEGKFIVPGSSSRKVLESDALVHLIANGSESHRNWCAWAIAKCCAYDGLSEDEALEVLEKFNQALASNSKGKLTNSGLKSKIKNAYSKNDGRLPLDFIYRMTGMRISLCKKWVKNKKARSERTLTHGHEWLEDLIEELKKTGGNFEGSQKALAERLNAPLRSIKKLVKDLREGKYKDITKSKLLVMIVGSGRAAKTVITLKMSAAKKKITKKTEKKTKNTSKIVNLSNYKLKARSLETARVTEVVKVKEKTVRVANKIGKGRGGWSPFDYVVILHSNLYSRMSVELVDPVVNTEERSVFHLVHKSTDRMTSVFSRGLDNKINQK